MVTREKPVSCINDIIEFISVNDSLINLLGPYFPVKGTLRSTCCCDGDHQKDGNSVLDKDMMLFLKTRDYRTKCIGMDLMKVAYDSDNIEASVGFSQLLSFEWTKSDLNAFSEDQRIDDFRMRNLKKELMYAFSVSNHLDTLLSLNRNPFTPYPNPYYIFSDICTRMNHGGISLPESYEALEEYIENARKLVSLLENNKTTTDHQEKKRRMESFAHANNVIDSLVEVCDQWKEERDIVTQQDYFMRIHTLQVELMKILSTKCSAHYVEEKKGQFDILSLVCIMRDPFSKLMNFLRMSSPFSYLHTPTDNWYITILAVIQQYYVLAIHEVIMYLVVFVMTYHFGINRVPIMIRSSNMF